MSAGFEVFPMVTTLEHTDHGRIRRATITRGHVGWHYQEHCDSRMVREATYTDWHRVERAIQAFERNAHGAVSRDSDDEPRGHSTKR